MLPRSILLVVAFVSPAFVSPALAQAQTQQGLYVTLGGGANIAGDLLASREQTKLYTSLGGLGLVDVGWGWGNGLRVELEGSYRSNNISGISTRRANGDLLPLSNSDGAARTYAVMANVAYDLPVHLPGFPMQPYIGGGLGYGWLDLGNASGIGTGTPALSQGNSYNGPTAVRFGSGSAFAYQAMIGASMPLQVAPGLSFMAEYRFFGTAGFDIPVNRIASSTANSVNGAVSSASARNSFTAADNAFLVGIRYSFGPR